MQITDSCVFPYPLGDSSVRRMALAARDLGFDSIVAVDAPNLDYAGVHVYPGVLIRETAAKDAILKVRRGRETGRIVMVQARDNGFNRSVIGAKGLHVLCGIHDAERNAFDHVTAKMAADNNVAVDIDLSPVIGTRGIVRQRAIHRYRDVLVLSRRFGFPVTLSTHARSVLEMRPVRECAGLCPLVGMNDRDAEAALAGIATVTSPRDHAVKVIG
ncbi:MAG TPA: RNase P subunit p30 family protein [Methanoregula sp.]|nr:RNase P subunit p30 family protein [Methanoregula sp.]